MIIPDNVTVYMNGHAYYAHVCGFYQNNERLSLSIDTSCLKDNTAEVNRVEPLNPVRREISINAQINGKSVNISYDPHDPHDPEAVKAAEVWRKALFAVKDENNVKFGEQQCRDYLKGAVERYLQSKQKHIDQAVAAMKPWTPCKPAETVKSNESAAPEPDKLDYDPLYDTLIDPLPFEYLCYWEKIAQEYSKVREAWDNGKRARIPRHINDFLSILSKRLSKDQEKAMEAMLHKPDATDEGGTT